MKKTFIIAEMGVNHNGDMDVAYRLIDAAAAAGADAVKTQSFLAETLVTKSAQKASYQKALTGDETQFSMLKKLEISEQSLVTLTEYATQKDILLLSTPFDIQTLRSLALLEMPIFKIPSGEITNLPYLIEIAQTKRPVILSTGMSTLQEIQAALIVLEQHGATDISLLHCNTQYPTPFEDANLLAIQTLRKEFGRPVGYSDHTPGIEASIAAVALGAEIIEKHFTLSRNMKGPDHKASIEPDELKAMVRAIRNIEHALGDGVKRVTPSERDNIAIARKSIVAARDIKQGERFTPENITTKRPGTGVSPMEWYDVLGCMAMKDFPVDSLILTLNENKQ